MNISNEILEKYHLNTCTAEERRMVEEWLFNTDADDLDITALPVDKNSLKQEMWQEIETVLPQEVKPLPKRSNVYFMWKGAIAASLLIALAGTIVYFAFAHKPAPQTEFVELNNPSAIQVKHIDATGYNVSLGPNTIAKINSSDGMIDLTGSILISPKKDIDLVFEGTDKKVTLLKGQTYIILKNKTGVKSIIVISERNLMDLPPVMQKQLSAQFDI
ncbi:hypothetical protein [Pedobacter sp. UBA5917]|jgi:hypothetical protein|uniref:hypothetical protein n=1 Tax=Pedobacter sp. UBA5917 TaxID=1947061 RepID=UPI0025E76A9E|nr:hypothetical protein [Pedobacter sp. UBA5917]